MGEDVAVEELRGAELRGPERRGPERRGSERSPGKRRSLDELAREIRSIETSGRPAGLRISSGSSAMDALLPGGGYGAGTMIEWVHGGEGYGEGAMPVRGLGSLSLAMRVALQGMTGGKYLVLVDRHHRFYAPGWIGLGGSLDRLIVLRPECDTDAIWGMDQALRNPSVGAVVAAMHRLDDRVARRLQLATEHGGGLGILVRDAHAARRYPSWADVQWRVRPSISSRDWQTRWFDLQLMRAGEGRSGARLRIGLDAHGQWVDYSEGMGVAHESAGALHLASELAKPARRRNGIAV
ncbi:MAG: ImuA family protein [Planctomycetota bacterium]